jgi:hypoxanthine-guanine phosphoribosyltransferase
MHFSGFVMRAGGILCKNSLAVLLDCQMARRVQLQPDYFGFLVDQGFLVGYGLGSGVQLYRNLPYLALAPLGAFST